MAKVAFSKLDLKVNNAVKSVEFINSKNETIAFDVKEYLPIEDKLDLVSNIINESIDDNGYYNPMRVKIFTVLEITYAYTNLSFTEKQKENIFKLYDQLISSNIFTEIKNCILPEDWDEINNMVSITINNIYQFKNSAMGILETISQDYANLDLDARNIQTALGDPTNLTLLKDIMTKLG